MHELGALDLPSDAHDLELAVFLSHKLPIAFTGWRLVRRRLYGFCTA